MNRLDPQKSGIDGMPGRQPSPLQSSSGFRVFDRGRYVAGVVAAIIVASDAMSLPVFADTPKWWMAAKTQRELQLTTEQVEALDKIFQSNLHERRRLAEEEKRLEAQLEAAFQSGVEDTRTVYPLIDTVARIHAQRNVYRTQMLFRMYKVLTADQRQRMKRTLFPPAR